jgi:cell division septation protein DedD
MARHRQKTRQIMALLQSPRGNRLRLSAMLLAGAALVSGCSETRMPGVLGGLMGAGDTVARASTGQEARIVERDIEAPEIFQAAEAGLWDGRPSLGGVWVAHPDVSEPERVIIRNERNGQFVIGALFRRERETPGPRLQISSDAAAALGILAGQPTNLDVVALRREAVPSGRAIEVAVDLPETGSDATDAVISDADPVVAGAAEAIETAALGPVSDVAPAPAASGLDKPYIQIGIFSIEQNARNSATAMRQAGMLPTVKRHAMNGKTYWRVVVGPAPNAAERAQLLDAIRGQGFADAYAVGG